MLRYAKAHLNCAGHSCQSGHCIVAWNRELRYAIGVTVLDGNLRRRAAKKRDPQAEAAGFWTLRRHSFNCGVPVRTGTA